MQLGLLAVVGKGVDVWRESEVDGVGGEVVGAVGECEEGEKGPGSWEIAPGAFGCVGGVGSRDVGGRGSCEGYIEGVSEFGGSKICGGSQEGVGKFDGVAGGGMEGNNENMGYECALSGDWLDGVHWG